MFNTVNPRWSYQIFKSKKSAWTEIEEQSQKMNRIGLG